MQSTGQTSMHASQPVQLSARTTASSLGNFLRALPAPLAMTGPSDQGKRGPDAPGMIDGHDRDIITGNQPVGSPGNAMRCPGLVAGQRPTALPGAGGGCCCSTGRP